MAGVHKTTATSDTMTMLIGALLRVPAQTIHRRITSELNAEGFGNAPPFRPFDVGSEKPNKTRPLPLTFLAATSVGPRACLPACDLVPVTFLLVATSIVARRCFCTLPTPPRRLCWSGAGRPSIALGLVASLYAKQR